MSETQSNEQCQRWNVPADRMAAVRKRMQEAANNTAGSGDRATFKTWQDAKETIRELDAVEGDQTHEAE